MTLAACVAVGLFGMPVGATGSVIGPNERYFGFVNGKHSQAFIHVVCRGPAGGLRTGPPTPHQSVSVQHLRSGGGNTGSIAGEIWAEFDNDTVHVVGFTHYGSSKPIPTALRLPCRGTGTVRFATCFGTQPCGATARDNIVRVTFVNIARRSSAERPAAVGDSIRLGRRRRDVGLALRPVVHVPV
jgi:hypothetical protein